MRAVGTGGAPRLVLAAGLLVALDSVGYCGQGAAVCPRGIPQWSPGDWWIIASSILIDNLNNPEKAGQLGVAGRPPERSVFTVELKFVVRNAQFVRQSLCDVIEILPHRLPEAVDDDSQGEALWRLYLRRDDGSLARCEWNLRRYPCYVSGKLLSTGSRDYPKHTPVVNVVRELVPLDVPLLPAPIPQMRPLPNLGKTLTYEDQWTGARQNQTVEVYEDVIMGKRTRVVLVTIWSKAVSTRTQLWVPGCPWWLEWRRGLDCGRLREGVVRARLLACGGDEKPTTEFGASGIPGRSDQGASGSFR